MSFFDIYGERLINRRFIREVRFERKGGSYGTGCTIITMVDGDRINLTGNHLSEIAEVDAVVPAMPGFRVLCYWHVEGGQASDNFVDEHPIIAWHINGDGAKPITPDWDINAHGDLVVLYPDGRVISSGDRQWPNQDEWLNDMAMAARERATMEAEEVAKEAAAREAAAPVEQKLDS